MTTTKVTKTEEYQYSKGGEPTTIRSRAEYHTGNSLANDSTSRNRWNHIMIARSASGQGSKQRASFKQSGGGGGVGVDFVDGYRRSMSMMGRCSSHLATTGVNSIAEGRTREKHDMQDLNQRFSNYIEKVRLLEVQNRKLASDLTKLREKWSSENEKVKATYDEKLKNLRRELDDKERIKAEVEVKITSLEDKICDIQFLIEDAKQQKEIDEATNKKLQTLLTEYQNELTILRKRVETFDEERERDMKDMQRLRAEIKRLRDELDQETLIHIKAEIDCQSARETVDFYKLIYEAELSDLSALATRDTMSDNKDWWKSQLKYAINDIKNEYERKFLTIKQEWQYWFQMKLQEYQGTGKENEGKIVEMREEYTRIKTHLDDLRAKIPDLEARYKELQVKLNEILRISEELRRDYQIQESDLILQFTEVNTDLSTFTKDLQELLYAKLCLELEISAYRKLLEGEETRISTSFENGGVMSISGGESSGGFSSAAAAARSEMFNMAGGEIAKIKFDRTAKGSVTIKEIAADGSCLVLENTGSRRQDVSGWSIERNIDNGKSIITYTFPNESFLENEGPRKNLTVWAKGKRPRNSKDCECDDANWGTGSIAKTILYNAKGDERATHTARMVESSMHS